MRIYLLYILVLALIIYAWRDWFISLCGLILLLAVSQRRDFPTYILDIQGMNPWNILFAVILVAWLVQRRAQGVRWDMPRFGNVAIGLFVLVLTVAVVRGLFDFQAFQDRYGGTPLRFLSDEWINPIKFLLLGIMLYDGARTRQRVSYALLVVLAVPVAWALLTLKFMPLGDLVSEMDFMSHRGRLDRFIGLFATDLGMVFAGTFWAVLSLWPLWKRGWQRAGILGTAVIVLLALALTHARGGYVTFIGLGLIFAVLRWRWLLVLLPIGVIVSVAMIPSVGARLGMGFGLMGASGDTETDLDAVTSGRTSYLWPNALDEISSRPLVGAGRVAILHTPMYEKVFGQTGQCPRHPHNAYLELFMDAGLIGGVPVLGLYFGLAAVAAALLRSRGDPLRSAVGGAALACTGMLLVAGLGSQTLFGNQVSTVSLWLTGALAMRMRRESAPSCRSLPVTGPVGVCA